MNALEALTAQKGIDEAEIIVIDDGSTDDTLERIKNFQVRYFYKSNGGPASARNMGIKEAKGSVVLFIDSDCIPQKNWFQSLTQPFLNPEVSGVKGIYITRQKDLIARFVQLEFEERYRMLAQQETIDFVDSYCAAFRKEALVRVNGFDPSFPKPDNEDVDLSFRLARAGYRMIFQPEAVVEHKHPRGLWKYVKVKFNRGMWRTAVYRRHPGKAVKDSYTPQTLKLQILSVIGLWGGLVLGALTGLWLPAALSLAVFIALIVHFMLKVFKFDPVAALISPIMLFIRANCFIAGIIAGINRQIISENSGARRTA